MNKLHCYAAGTGKKICYVNSIQEGENLHWVTNNQVHKHCMKVIAIFIITNSGIQSARKNPGT